MNETRLEIYKNRDKRFEKELATLNSCKISVRNKELLTQWHNYLFSTGSGQLRVAKLSSQLRVIVSLLKGDLDKVEKSDILNLIGEINRCEKWSDVTRADYRRATKQFYKWFRDEDSRLFSSKQDMRLKMSQLYRVIEKDIKISAKKRQIDFSNILTEEIIDRVVDKGCRTIKEKAFIRFLHETGVRAGELLNIKLKEIVIKENHCVIHVDGKTGRRGIPITNSVPYLVQYLDIHPFKDNENSYLWLSDSNYNRHSPLLHASAQQLINRCFENAGFVKIEKVEYKLANGKTRTKTVSREVLKKHNLHWFRHSRASLLAPHLTEVLLCKYMGWVLGSKQVRNYVHLCTEQLEDGYLQMKGIKIVDRVDHGKPTKCGCGSINDKKSAYCYKCGRPLRVKELMDEETNKTMQLFMEIANNPELMAKFNEFKKSFGSDSTTNELKSK